MLSKKGETKSKIMLFPDEHFKSLVLEEGRGGSQYKVHSSNHCMDGKV
jgi:hypothetical protein